MNRFAVRGKDLEAAGFAAPGQFSAEAVERVAAGSRWGWVWSGSRCPRWTTSAP